MLQVRSMNSAAHRGEELPAFLQQALGPMAHTKQRPTNRNGSSSTTSPLSSQQQLDVPSAHSDFVTQAFSLPPVRPASRMRSTTLSRP